jgi:hypothetical protein
MSVIESYKGSFTNFGKGKMNVGEVRRISNLTLAKYEPNVFEIR